MITIRTFLRSPDGTFQQVETCETPPADPDYVEGALELSIDGLEIVGRSEWDYIDQLWAYVADMVMTLKSANEASTYFPDQPIRLSFQRSGTRILVSSEIGPRVKRVSTDESELLTALRDAGGQFFATMGQLLPANSVSYQLAAGHLIA